ncbi:glycerophosphoryl diester phosphodiesterase [Microthyrium microscopicum]|uniref:glycerophosphodiester phosphodiesterase n=1 Tax=Microthyrium microscopicum TaxID=703497 RepID=A0A6A6UE73_9PEZI|nr:glycerophosphoryl diester phosphodiesterase [Microthyrium microscopicum]
MSSSIVNLLSLALVASIANGLPQILDSSLSKRHTAVEAPLAKSNYYISFGPRPFYIINNMTASPLKTKLQSCENGPFEISTFVFGHRGGGTLQFPEETVESTMAGARMGAGVLECDVSFTGDRGLVCRHSLCDLHTTTNILLKPELAKKCTIPFTPANGTAPANALCCTSDITTAEYTSLCGKQDGFNASAKTPADYQYGTPTWRTELYDTCGTVMTLDSYITLVDSLPGYRNFTPELKTPPAQVPMPFKGYTQEQYARDMLNAFINRGIDPSRVWAQSFNPPDIYQWLKEFPAFGKQAVFLDESGDTPSTYNVSVSALAGIKAKGVNIISPPFNYLLTLTPDNKTIIPSPYALEAKRVGLDIVSWSFDRSGPLAKVLATGEYYYSSIAPALSYDGQMYNVLDVLINQVGVKGMFSDWASTVVYFANCFGLKGPVSSNYK